MRILNILAILIFGLFAVQGWAPPPGQGSTTGGASVTPDISKCDLKPANQTKVKAKGKDGKDYFICTGQAVCAGKAVPVTCKVSEREPCPTATKCVSFDLELISSEEIRECLNDGPGTPRELDWRTVGNFHCEFMKGYPNIFRISEGLKEPLMICGGFAKCEYGKSYLYCPEKKGGGCPEADQCRGIDPKLTQCRSGQEWIHCGEQMGQYGCAPKGSRCCNHGICRGAGPWTCPPCGGQGGLGRCAPGGSVCCNGGVCEGPGAWCDHANGRCGNRR